MAAAAGRNFLLQLGDGASTETFTTVGGGRALSISIDNTEVDVTTKGDAGIRMLLAQAGVRSGSVSFSGVFTDTAGQDALADAAIAGTHHNFRLVEATTNNVQFALRAQVTNFEVSGDEGDAMLFSCTLASTGAITLTNS